MNTLQIPFYTDAIELVLQILQKSRSLLLWVLNYLMASH